MTMNMVTRRGHEAARLARVLWHLAEPAGAWVSAEASVRVGPVDVWRPSVVVATCDLPADGVVGGTPLLVVELDSELVDRWRRLPQVTVWALCAGTVAVRRGERTEVLDTRATLTVEDAEWLALPAGVLLAATQA